MLSTKKLIRMARKWQKMAKASRKRISLPRTLSRSTTRPSSSPAKKGHFVVYTSDQRRYALPMVYLQSEIFIELLRLAEEEFGLTSDGPIMLPCDSIFMKYAISILQRQVARELEESLIVALFNTGCSSSSSSAICLHQAHLVTCN